jgi:hypothetical protein
MDCGMPTRTSVDWVRIRAAFIERTESVVAIAERYGSSPATIYRRAQAENWLAEVPSAIAGDGVRAGLLRRLYRTIDRKLAQLEARMETDDELSIADHERETRAIGQLIRNVEKIAELEETASSSARKRGSANAGNEFEHGEADAEQIRRELAERILRFREIKRCDG